MRSRKSASALRCARVARSSRKWHSSPRHASAWWLTQSSGKSAYAQTPRCPIKRSELDLEYHGDPTGIVWHLESHRRQSDRMRLCSHHQHEMKARDEEYAKIVADAQPVLDWIRPLLPAHRLAKLDRLKSDSSLVVWTDKGFVDID